MVFTSFNSFSAKFKSVVWDYFHVQSCTRQLDPTKKWEISKQTPIFKFVHFGNVMSIDMTLPKRAIFTIGCLCRNYLSFVGSKWSFVSDYIKNVDTYHVSFSLNYNTHILWRDVRCCVTLGNVVVSRHRMDRCPYASHLIMKYYISIQWSFFVE